MPRYFFEISYEGTNFLGWQKQLQTPTVQGCIEDALSKLFSLKKISIMGCGRTDTGVHAKKYYFHTDLSEKIDENQFIFKLNLILPKSISIHKIVKVDKDLHARFNAELRTYKYFIHGLKDPFKSNVSWWIKRALDIEAMNKAAKMLIGTYDFETFSKTSTDVKTHICSVKKAQFTMHENNLVFEISANRFLRNMVRAIVGTLVEVGLQKIKPEEFQSIINAKSRQKAASSAPAEGLFLWDVLYPKGLIR